MECPECGRACQENYKFCSECGYNLHSARTAQTDLNRVEGGECSVLTAESSGPTAASKSHAHSNTGPPADGIEETVKDGTQKSGVESGNQQRDTTPAEHVTCDTPSTDRENQRETTPSRSSLDPAPAPETTSQSLAQSEPITACPDKPDTKSGLVDSDDMERTLSKNSKDTVSTSQEDEEEEEEFEDAFEHLEDEAEVRGDFSNNIQPQGPLDGATETKDPEESVTLSKGISKGEDTPEETVPEEHRELMPMEGLTIGAVTFHSISLNQRWLPGVKDMFTSVLSYLSSGDQKRHTSTISHTALSEPSAPERLRVEEVRSRSVRLLWDPPTKMEGVSYTFSITYTCATERTQRADDWSQQQHSRPV
ncbi:hypothetical protein AAFF_G00303160 [Aldrovandia affinis]|uniref:Fibronectin type-III domain-containing protein n=1 Tax=Aldrovandia affinis TaxID=143900 RepID=A0AAD7R8S2_9TELE|nr:hypothetical protein AAFF_G00303160 [Aldrovandia affinis]